MNTLICTTPHLLEYAETDKSILKKDHAIVKIERIGICGTDLHAFEGTQPFFNYPRILGHELSGVLVEIDGESDFKIGESVSVIPYFNCGTCIACRTNKPNCCVNMQVFGVHIDGGMREYVSVPKKALLHGDSLSFDQLALVEPLAIGAHGIRRAAVQAGEFVLVIGAGPIGLGAMEFARIAGARVIALDINDNRLRFCREKLGVDFTLNATQDSVFTDLKEITNGDMPTVIVDATGNQKAINNAFQYLAHGGRFVLIGLQKGEISFSHPEFHKREATLMSSRNANLQDFEQVVFCLKEGLIDPLNYITHRVSFSSVKDHFDQWLDPKNGVIKAMVSFESE